MSQKFTVWQDMPMKAGKGKWYWGDIPVGSYNEITEQFEAVENTRNYAYALRNQKRYRKSKRELLYAK